MPDSCYEVKYSDRVNSEDISHLEDVKVKKRTVIDRNQTGRIGDVDLAPLWSLLLSE